MLTDSTLVNSTGQSPHQNPHESLQTESLPSLLLDQPNLEPNLKPGQLDEFDKKLLDFIDAQESLEGQEQISAEETNGTWDVVDDIIERESTDAFGDTSHHEDGDDSDMELYMQGKMLSQEYNLRRRRLFPKHVESDDDDYDDEKVCGNC